MRAAKTATRGDCTVNALNARYRRRWTRSIAAGFTLVELMIVVAIVGVLAVIAIVGYNKYVRSAASGEARAMLQSIRGAEDNYKAEVLNYMSCPTGGTFAAGDFYPRVATALDSRKSAWINTGNSNFGCWQTLNVKSSGPVRYSFSVLSGNPGPLTAPKPAPIPAAAWPYTGASQTANPWFVAVAEGDYDGDGQLSSMYIGSEMSDVVVINDTE